MSDAIILVAAAGLLFYLSTQKGPRGQIPQVAESKPSFKDPQKLFESDDTTNIIGGSSEPPPISVPAPDGSDPRPRPPPPPPVIPPPPPPEPAPILKNPLDLGISDIVKQNIADAVLAKTASALLNETGQRKALAEQRANVALQNKKEAALKKLGVLEQKKANLDALKDKYATATTEAKLKKEQARLDKINAQQQAISDKKASLKVTLREQAASATQLRLDADKARVQSTTSAKITAKGNTTKPILGHTKHRINANFAVRLNDARANFGRQLASLRIPKFTMRGAVHSGASMFGFLVMAYDMARMFDPSIDIWKQNRAGAPAPEVEVPLNSPDPYPNPIPTVLPTCDSVVENGTATPIKPVLCRENIQKPWETLSSDQLTYTQECPPGWNRATYGSYTRCTLATNYDGQWFSWADWPEQARYWRNMVNRNTTGYNPSDFGDDGTWKGSTYIEANRPNQYASMPQEYFDKMGLTKFVADLNKDLESGNWNFVNDRTTPGTWQAGEAYSTATPTESFHKGRFLIFTNPSKLAFSPSRVAGWQDDPDWPYQQYRKKDQWGQYEGVYATNSKYLGDFAQPHSDVGLSVRGGESLSAADRIKALYPDATPDEIESAIVNSNADDIANR